MKAFFFAVALAAGGAAFSYAQMGRTTDWWTYAGDAQRTGFEKNDQKFLKEDVKNFRQLWKMKLEGAKNGPGKLAAPVILGNLIGSRGFKELAFVQSASGGLWSIDADLARMYWEKQFPPPEANGQNCGGSATVPNLPAPVVFRFRKRPPTPSTPTTPPPTAPSGTPGGRGIPGGGPGAPATGLPAGAPPAAKAPTIVNAAFRVRPIYMLSPDGKLHELNLDDGSELRPGMDFVPGGLSPQSMNIADNVIYTVTQSCGQTPSAVYALDVSAPTPKAVSFSSAAPIHSTGGPAISGDGTIYVQTGNGPDDAAKGSYANAVIALTEKDLTAKDYVILPGGGKEETGMNITTPVLFNYQGREMVVTAGKDGRLYLLDASSLGGSDHKTPVSRTEPLVEPVKAADKGIWRNLSSWTTLDGTRYVLATVWGPLQENFKAPIENGKTPNGSVVAFKVAAENGNLSLVPAWVSHDLMTPDPPVVAQGVVFALSNGKYKRKMKKNHSAEMAEETPANQSHATLYAMDGLTGKEMWSTGDDVSAPGSLTGLSIANSRLYFTTVDGTLQVFGKYLETGL